MKRITEIWVSKNGSTKERITWNPCNCHPNDVMREYGNNFKKAVSYVSQNKSAFTKWMKKRNMERISREVKLLNG